MPTELDLARDHLIRACLVLLNATVRYDKDHAWRKWARMNLARWKWRVRNLARQERLERN